MVSFLESLFLHAISEFQLLFLINPILGFSGYFSFLFLFSKYYALGEMLKVIVYQKIEKKRLSQDSHFSLWYAKGEIMNSMLGGLSYGITMNGN